MYFLTSSYINTEERLQYLNLCAKSVSEICPEAKHHISVYVKDGIDKSLLPSNVIVRDRRMKQFEQFALLLQEIEFHDDDMIIFLDDDDLLLSMPTGERVNKSTQILYKGNEKQNWNREEFLEFFRRNYNENDFEFVRDLSGYGAQYKYLKNYSFNQGSFPDLQDTDFMNYIDSLEDGLCYQPPYILHRMHETNGANSSWMEGLVDEIDRMPKLRLDLPGTKSYDEKYDDRIPELKFDLPGISSRDSVPWNPSDPDTLIPNAGESGFEPWDPKAIDLLLKQSEILREQSLADFDDTTWKKIMEDEQEVNRLSHEWAKMM